MRGVVARDSQCVVVSDLPEPSAASGSTDVVIAVEAAGVNRLDTMQRKGKAKPPPGTTECLGLEVAGKVLSSASGKFDVGAEVMALVSGGAFAEKVVCPEETVMLKPANLSMTLADDVPETWLTAYQLLFMVAGVQPGDAVLLHAAASGVGIAATQLATQFGASAATASSREKVSAAWASGDRRSRDAPFVGGRLARALVAESAALLPEGKKASTSFSAAWGLTQSKTSARSRRQDRALFAPDWPKYGRRGERIFA